MHDALGDALVVKVHDLFAQDEVFEEGWATISPLKGVLIVCDRDTLVCREHPVGCIDAHAIE